MKLENVVLQGRYVRLEPLSQYHLEGLSNVIADGELWRLPVTLVPERAQIPQFIDDANDSLAQGTALAFATVWKETGEVVGSSRFMKYEQNYKKLEIGYTFIAKSWQRSVVNTEAKYLMMKHGFEQLQLNRIELLTDFLDHRSRQAIARLGAKEEGVLRNHMVMRDGRVRDSVIFSVIANEWPGVRQHLEGKLL